MDTKPLTVGPTFPQIDQKLGERLRIAAEKAGITRDQFQIALGYQGTALEDELAGVFLKYANKASGITASESKPEPATHPAVGEWFELEIDGDLNIAPSNWTPLESKWPAGKRKYRAKLLDLGYQRNLDEARKAAKAKEPNCVMGPGQAREPFMAAYPRHSGRPVVFGGNEWRDGSRGRRVAVLDDWRNGGAWRPGFGFSGIDFGEVCLWLVVEQVA